MRRVEIPEDMAGRGTLGCIVKMPSGILWTNQAGGTLCAHPEVEGIYVPVMTCADFDEGDPMVEKRRGSMDDVASWLKAMTLRDLFEPRPTMEGEEVMEAWVPVRIRSDIADWPESALHAFAGMDAVLVYQNSD